MVSDGDNLHTSDLAASRRERDPSERSSDDPGASDRGTHDRSSGSGTSAAVNEQPLLPLGDLEGFRERWESVQTYFVDEPRQAVADADGLVAEVMQRLADTFARERSQLESQWDRGDDVSTEDLRVSLQRYRSFFNRLIHL